MEVIVSGLSPKVSLKSHECSLPSLKYRYRYSSIERVLRLDKEIFCLYKKSRNLLKNFPRVLRIKDSWQCLVYGKFIFLVVVR